MRIVIDVMGAELGVAEMVKGVAAALKNNKNFTAILVGDAGEIKAAQAKFMPDFLKNRVEVIHCTDFIHMEESAAHAIKRDTASIFLATQMLVENKADALVSPGHSGATMSLATMKIGRIKGVLRPAICTLMPTTTALPSMILDAGANTDCKAEFLRDFAIMGLEYAKGMGYETPRVGLLSNGEESNKGNELTKAAHALLRDEPRLSGHFKGNVEGRDIFNGSVDIIVCDGFTGNVALKVAEGVATCFGRLIKAESKKCLCGILGSLMMWPVFRRVKKKVDHAEYGGAPLLGVRKPVIIGHGSSTARAIECAINQAIKTIDGRVCEKIEAAFGQISGVDSGADFKNLEAVKKPAGESKLESAKDSKKSSAESKKDSKKPAKTTTKSTPKDAKK